MFSLINDEHNPQAVLGLIISIVYLHHLPSSAFFSLNQIVHPQRDEFVKDYLITDIEADYKSKNYVGDRFNRALRIKIRKYGYNYRLKCPTYIKSSIKFT